MTETLTLADLENDPHFGFTRPSLGPWTRRDGFIQDRFGHTVGALGLWSADQRESEITANVEMIGRAVAFREAVLFLFEFIYAGEKDRSASTWASKARTLLKAGVPDALDFAGAEHVSPLPWSMRVETVLVDREGRLVFTAIDFGERHAFPQAYMDSRIVLMATRRGEVVALLERIARGMKDGFHAVQLDARTLLGMGGRQRRPFCSKCGACSSRSPEGDDCVPCGTARSLVRELEPPAFKFR